MTLFVFISFQKKKYKKLISNVIASVIESVKKASAHGCQWPWLSSGKMTLELFCLVCTAPPAFLTIAAKRYSRRGSGRKANV